MKRTIKLTESTLRSMIQEAVNEAIAQPNHLNENRLRNMIKEAVKSTLSEVRVNVDGEEDSLHNDEKSWKKMADLRTQKGDFAAHLGYAAETNSQKAKKFFDMANKQYKNANKDKQNYRELRGE